MLLTPEVRSSNPATGKFLTEHLFTANGLEKTKIKKKRPGKLHFPAFMRVGIRKSGPVRKF